MEIQAGYGEIKEVSSMKREEPLEEAYKNLKEQETPDLWSRIEAGIELEDLSKEEVRIPRNNEKKATNRRIAGKQVRTAAMMVAAVVILFISISLVSRRMNFYQKPKDNAVEVSPERIVDEDMISEDMIREDMINEENGSKNAQKGETFSDIKEMEKDDSDEKEAAVNEKNQDFADKAATGLPVTNNLPENGNSRGENIDTDSVAVSIRLRKDLEVKVSSLKKIKVSDLSSEVQEELKELLQDYNSCQFYKSESGEVYVEDNKILYLAEGVTVTVEE